MPDASANKKRIAKNTLFLYIRTIFIMAVSLYTSRVVLEALGVDNYGIYNVVGGFVTMFTALSGALTAASQRFLAYELGKPKPNVRKVFSTTLNIHALLSILIFIALESFGVWFLNHKMNINIERIEAANWVLQCSILTFCINIISIPYNAAIIAYEKMSTFAYIGILEAVLKLIVAYALYIMEFDALIVYAVLMLIVAICMRIIYSGYCIAQLKDCRFSFSLDKATFCEMLAFSGWNFIGQTAGVMNNQAINVLTNLFFGVSLNAARGIASQIDAAINTFVSNFTMALTPQITKAYAAGEYDSLNKLIIYGSKYCFFLFSIICVPVFLNVEYILSIWLVRVPDFVPTFVRLAFLFSLCQSLSQCLYSAMLATGHIKKYQIIVGGLSILAFPLSYTFFKIGLSAEYGYVAIILSSLMCFVARLWLLKGMIPGFSTSGFVSRVLFPIMQSAIPIIAIVLPLYCIADKTTFYTFIGETALCMLLTGLSIYTFGLTKKERNMITNVVRNKLIKSKK